MANIYLYILLIHWRGLFFNCINFKGKKFIQCKCTFSTNILSIGNLSGNVFFMKIEKFLEIKYVNNNDSESENRI